MSAINHKKNTAYYLALPLIDSATPAQYKTGLSPTDTAYYKDGAGAWTSLAITDTFAEIGSTGVYEIDLTASELNHDQVLIKVSSAGACDDMVLFDMRTALAEDVDTTIGAAGAGLTALATAAALATVDANVDAILVDTGTTIPSTLTTIAGYIDTEVAAIKAVTDLLPDAGALSSLATAAAVATIDTNVDVIQELVDSMFHGWGTIASVTDTNTIVLNAGSQVPPSSVAVKGCQMVIVDAVNAYQRKTFSIIGWNDTTRTIDFYPASSFPATGDKVYIFSLKSLMSTADETENILTINNRYPTIDWNSMVGTTGTVTLTNTTVGTVTTNTDMRGTDNAALASVCTEARLAELDAANLPTDIAALNTILTSTGAVLTSGERDSIAAALLDLANGVETSYTVRQAMRIMLSALAAQSSGQDANAPVFRDVNNTKDRITATTSSDGRTSVTLDAT